MRQNQRYVLELYEKREQVHACHDFTIAFVLENTERLTRNRLCFSHSLYAKILP